MLRELGQVIGETKNDPILTTTNGRDPFGNDQQSLVRQAWAQTWPTAIGLSYGCLTALCDPYVLYALPQQGQAAVSGFLRDVSNLSLAAVFGDAETHNRIKQRTAGCAIYDAGGQPAWFVNAVDGPKAFSLKDPAILERIILRLVNAVAKVHWGIGIIESGSREYLKDLQKNVLVPAFGIELGAESMTDLHMKAGRIRPLVTSQTQDTPLSAAIAALKGTALGADFGLESQWPIILGFMHEIERRCLGIDADYTPAAADAFDKWCTGYYRRATNHRLAAGMARPTLTADDFFDISRGHVVRW